MTTETDTLALDLRAGLKCPAIGLPDYSADLAAQRRVGRIITSAIHRRQQLRAPFTEGNTAHIKQNTINKGFFRGRRMG